jgi:peptidoglycan/xylan/chitin deacetylase (PgdA/CDA1 family)
VRAAPRWTVSVLRELRERRPVVLCYHGVGPRNGQVDPGFLRVPPARFRLQVEALAAAGFEFVTVAELVARGGGGRPPAGLAALSFDDGMDDNHRVLLPILRELGIPGTVYVATGLIGRPNPWMGAGSRARMMTAAELRDLADAGVELGAHTVTHPDLSRVGRRECLREMVESKRTLEQVTGAPVRTFAYPFCRYSPEAVDAAREAGFAAAVTCWRRGSWDPFELGRTVITGKDGVASFVLKLAGAYEPLFASAPGRFVRATTRSARGRVRTAMERTHA